MGGVRQDNFMRDFMLGGIARGVAKTVSHLIPNQTASKFYCKSGQNQDIFNLSCLYAPTVGNCTIGKN